MRETAPDQVSDEAAAAARAAAPIDPATASHLPQPLREVKPQYTADAMRAKVQGTGSARMRRRCPTAASARVEVVRSLDSTFGLDQEAIKAAKQWRFRPGTRFGEPVAVLNVRREALRARIVGEVRAADAAAAEKTSAALDQAAGQRPDDPVAQSAMHFGRGMLALAKADLTTARGHFDQCLDDDYSCKYQGVLAAERQAMRPAPSACARRSSSSTFAIPFI